MLKYMLELFRGYPALFVLVGLSNVLLAILLSKKMVVASSRQVAEALGSRGTGVSFYRRCSIMVEQVMTACGGKMIKGGIYLNARTKLRKAGYKGENAALLYLSVRFVLSPIVYFAAFATNYPDIIRPLASVILINTVMETIISSNRKKLNLRFQKYIYKVYKYLHNQISSGVKPTDAVRSVYEVTDDRELEGILVRLAARYELTLDIDSALEEFRSNFDAHEAETLCIAIRQGIETGDNKELLAKQEDIMFKKYFNYIQAETESCRNRSVASAAVFVAIVVVMIIVPMLSEVGQAVGKIFIN